MTTSPYVGPLRTLQPLNRWPNVRVACVWLPQLSMRAEILRHPEWNNHPLVMAGGPADRKVVHFCSPQAEQAGIHPGLPLREVLTYCREAIVLQPDPVRSAAVIDDVLQRLQSVGPSVEAGLDGDREGASATLSTNGLNEALFLDLGGLKAAYEHDLGLLERAINAAVPDLLQARLGFASGKFPAFVAAQVAPACGSRTVPVEGAASFLASLSMHFLPLLPQVKQRLELLGIQTVGQVAALSLSALQAQFGKAGARTWRLANGRDDEPIVPRVYNPSVKTGLRCDDPIASIDSFLAALDQLLTRAFANPILCGGSARQVRIQAILSDGLSWEKSFTFKEALAGVDAARRALWGKLKAANMLPAAPIDELLLELLGLGSEVGRQLPLFGNRWRQERLIDEAARQLAVRYGQSPLFRAVEVEPWSRIPERRWALARVGKG